MRVDAVVKTCNRTGDMFSEQETDEGTQIEVRSTVLELDDSEPEPAREMIVQRKPIKWW